MDVASIVVLVSAVLSVVSVVVGASYKRKMDRAVELALDVVKAVQDDVVSEEECQKVAADVKAVLEG